MGMEKVSGVTNPGSTTTVGVGRAGFQEVATEDIKITVKNTEAIKYKAQPGFGILKPQQSPTAEASKFDPLRSVQSEGSKMQVKITQQTEKSGSAQKSGSSQGGASPQKKVPNRSFQEEKHGPSPKKSRWNNSSKSPSPRSPPKQYSGGNRRRSGSPQVLHPGRGTYYPQPTRSRYRSRSRSRYA